MSDSDSKKEPMMLSIDEFKPNGVVYAKQSSSNTKPYGATRKDEKTGETEEFVLKTGNYPPEASLEKIYCDLLALCGVKVPKTYLVADKKKAPLLASRKEQGYADLFVWLFSVAARNPQEDDRNRWQVDSPKAYKWLATQSMQGKNGEVKPIRGLYENVAIFMFLGDEDAVGGSWSNIGLIEHADHFEAVKIDPGMSGIRDDFHYPTAEKEYLAQLKSGKIKEYYGDKGENFKIFQHCRREQINDGMKRVARLTDAQLKAVIYNPEIPDVPTERRGAMFKILLRRRDDYKRAALELTLIERKEFPLFWVKENKYGISAVLLSGVPGAVMGARKEVLLDPGVYNALALAGMGICFALVLLGIKSGISKLCRANTANDAKQEESSDNKMMTTPLLSAGTAS